MSASTLAAGLVMAGFPGTGASNGILDLVRRGLAGVILFGRNLESIEQVRTLIGRLQDEAAAAGHPPLLVAVDHEGGRVQRLLLPGITRQPAAMAFGAAGVPGLTRVAAGLAASELLSLGINLNLAPCADLNGLPRSEVVGTRAFGSDPLSVARHVAAYVEGAQSEGLFTVVKHFPGHGATVVDSHLDLPVIDRGLDELRQGDLVPFRAAVSAGVTAVMPGHLVVSELTGELPATMSPAAIGGLLRSELGHAGLVISDCMEMNAITNGFTAADATCRAVAAGVDLVLWSHTLARQQAAVEALTDAAKSGLVPSHRLTDAFARVQALRRALTHDRAGLGRGASAGQRVDRIASAGSVFRRAITLVRDRDRVLPLRPGGPVLILGAGTGPRATALARAVEGLTDGMRAAGHAITGRCAVPGPDEAAELASLAAQASATALNGGTVLLLTRDAAFDPWQAAALRPLLRASGRRAVLVATGLPDDVAVLPEAGCAMCAFDDAGGALAALTEVMTGRAPAAGRLPVVLAG